MIALFLGAAVHHDEGEGFLSEYLDLLTNPAHIAFELTMEAASSVTVLIFGYLLGRGLIQRWIGNTIHKHDIEVHGHDCDDHSN